MAGPDPDDWVTLREAADALVVPLWKVRRWAADGEFEEMWRDGKGGLRAARKYQYRDITAVEARPRLRHTPSDL
jgi:hypothetical protein